MSNISKFILVLTMSLVWVACGKDDPIRFEFQTDTENYFSYKNGAQWIYKLNNGKILCADNKFSPSIIGGLGFANYSGLLIDNDGDELILPLGLGLKYNFNN